jgi:peptidoglycan-associated lipoprotein
MKAIRFGTLMALGLALSLVGSGCRPENMKRIPGQYPNVGDVSPKPEILPPPMPPMPPDTNVAMTPLPDTIGHTNWTANAEQLKEYSVHFTFDSSAVRAADKSKIASVADYLKANPAVAVRVEGNCDERGTEEYNRSLGERRALAIRELLIRSGVDAGHVFTRSFGKDQPAATGHDEAAHSKNRRGEFVLVLPKKILTTQNQQ